LKQLAAYGFADSQTYGRTYRRYSARPAKLLAGH
jgi:hypothetical protein